jgi:hypothetical protein
MQSYQCMNDTYIPYVYINGWNIPKHLSDQCSVVMCVQVLSCARMVCVCVPVCVCVCLCVCVVCVCVCVSVRRVCVCACVCVCVVRVCVCVCVCVCVRFYYLFCRQDFATAT